MDEFATKRQKLLDYRQNTLHTLERISATLFFNVFLSQEGKLMSNKSEKKKKQTKKKTKMVKP